MIVHNMETLRDCVRVAFDYCVNNLCKFGDMNM